MEGTIFYDEKHGTTYYSGYGESYNIDVSILPRVGKRKCHGIHPIGGFLVKFAQMDRKKFFSYEVRFSSVAVKELDIREPASLKAKSIEMAMKILEQGCYDDMILTVNHADGYVAKSSELPLQKHDAYYRHQLSPCLRHKKKDFL